MKPYIKPVETIKDDFVNLKPWKAYKSICLRLVMKKIGKKWLLFISVPAIIGFLFLFLFHIFHQPENGIQQPGRPFENATNNSTPPPFFGNQYRRIPVYSIILSPILLIIAIIPISYYFISKSLEEKLENNLELILKLFNKNDIVLKKNTKKENDVNIILKFLSPIERNVIEKLIENNGKVLQAEINRMEGMTKLKTHRAVKELERKGIIKRESFGKTNRIILSGDIKDILLK
jgi:DNA-binding MarR family transcriptional regulator